jgi:hypothetical protein
MKCPQELMCESWHRMMAFTVRLSRAEGGAGVNGVCRCITLRVPVIGD